MKTIAQRNKEIYLTLNATEKEVFDDYRNSLVSDGHEEEEIEEQMMVSTAYLKQKAKVMAHSLPNHTFVVEDEPNPDWVNTIPLNRIDEFTKIDITIKTLLIIFGAYAIIGLISKLSIWSV